jgi:transposase-like protein
MSIKQRYTISEACNALGCTRKTLHIWMDQLSIEPQDGSGGRDKRENTISVAEVTRLRKDRADRRTQPGTPPDLVSALERIEALEAELERYRPVLDRWLSIYMSPVSYDAPVPSELRSPRPIRATMPRANNSTLPEGWLTVREMMDRHALPKTTVERHYDSFPFHKGSWLHHGSYATRALDADQQREFVTYWRNHHAFQVCQVIDCTCHESVSRE